MKILILLLLLVFPTKSQAVDAFNSATIQQYIDELPQSGGVIKLQPGEYSLDTSHGSIYNFADGSPIKTSILINKDNVTLEGSGPETILKLAPHSKMRAISISAKNVTVRNLTIDGNKANRDGSVPWPNGDVVDGLLYGSDTADNLIFENLEIRNGIEDAMGCWKCRGIIGRNNYNHDNGTPLAGGAGFSLSGAIGGIAQNNRMENNTATGIWASFDANNIKILDNIIRSNSAGGITIGGGDAFNGLGANNSGFEIRRNVLSNNGLDKFATITVWASSNGVIDGNTIESSPYDSFQVGGTSEYQSSNWTISNNICAPNKLLNNLGYANSITLTSNSCETNFPQLKPGDFNQDNLVNLADYNLLIQNYKTLYTIADYSLLVANYNK